ncbi:hypothetical protein VTK73DRAFT_6682 [Phialemonium thermophilum]|uniref:Uncharacterized protein n=1 Tax=Phialemonium thermophilum TaxID=223376 RepID=A0ABR3WIK6_9PEZI
MLAVVALPEENASAYLACSRAATAVSKLVRLGLLLRLYSYSPTGLPTLVWAKVVDREMGSITAPVTGSCGEPACTASVPKPCTGDGARGGVEMEWSWTVMTLSMPQIRVGFCLESLLRCPIEAVDQLCSQHLSELLNDDCKAWDDKAENVILWGDDDFKCRGA